MESPDLNYFTCTLGQAALWKKGQPTGQPTEFSTVLELIDDQGRDIPNEPAIGFADFSDDGRHKENAAAQVTFGELKRLSWRAATVLSKRLGQPQTPDVKKGTTIGLICASSLDFVFTWLGLMRLGYKVFLLAPQLEEKAIDHLCSTTGADTMFVDRMYRDKVKGLNETLSILDIPSYDRSAAISSSHDDDDHSNQPAAVRKNLDTAYLRHTSGTSSGLPKPIYQSHWGAVGILPRLTPTKGKLPATFSTTPLYHGGLADCFRAWAAGASIWFFPEGLAPVTGANVVKAVECARQHVKESKPEIKVGYFTSVPYVLQMLSDSPDGIRLLQSMDLVGVGGAALPPAIGDRLVHDHNVNLVSRMGSAECGFLLSSHRDYATDKEWQFLRPAAGVADSDDGILAFEPRGDDGLSELVARPGWPLLAKTNRPDGSYATADLFAPHPSIPGAWRYHSRSDAQITLANGKKFDPSPLEGAILAATTQHLGDVLIFGGGRDYPGALLFPTNGDGQALSESESEVIDAVWPSIQKLNQDSPGHARLTKSMLVVVISETDGVESSLPKSSKGTIMRRQAEEQYGDLIEKAYQGGGSGSATGNNATSSQQYVSNDDDVPSAIAERFAQVLGRQQDLDPSRDLYGQGVDSIACIQARKAIERDLLPGGSGPLPMNIIYDCGTIDKMVEHVLRVRQRKQQSAEEDALDGVEERDADLGLMRDLVQQNSNFDDLNFSQRSDSSSTSANGTTVVLTGATGALGAHILHHLLRDPNIRRIYCLLRAQIPAAAHERVSHSLSKRGLTALDAWDEAHWIENRVACLPSELDRPDFGLAPRFLERINRDQPAVIIHSAWTVNFSLRIGSFGQHFAATRNLIRLAAQGGSRFYFVSSTAAVINSNNASSSSASVGRGIAEKVSRDPADASPLGYAKSKWVAENICAAAHERFITEAKQEVGERESDEDKKNYHDGPSAAHQPPVSIIRVGQLFANHLGIWNETEAYPLMLSTASFTGCLPDLGDAPLNWLPVELAAQAVIEIAFGSGDDTTINPTRLNGSNSSGGGGGGENDRIPVYHVLNPHREPTWHEMLEFISNSSGRKAARFETVSPSVWVQKLETSLGSDTSSGHSSQGLLDLWKGKYANNDIQTDPPSTKKSGPVFELSRTEAASGTIRDVQPLDKGRILQMWNWLQESSGLCS
ncbi:male sterility protein-domain-containing protein [Apiospora sp. TS-2023a]